MIINVILIWGFIGAAFICKTNKHRVQWIVSASIYMLYALINVFYYINNSDNIRYMLESNSFMRIQAWILIFLWIIFLFVAYRLSKKVDADEDF